MNDAQALRSTAFTTVDLDKPGKQIGFVMIPHSPHDDAWGVTRLPIGVIANGTGPTVIIEGGNHGDEYEGPITICELIRDLDPAEVQGRLILMPANNAPAVIAGQRTSPVDGLNLNRTFPGDPRGTITQQISAFLVQEIFPRGDAFLDLHSGGSSLDIVPSAVIEPTDDPELRRRNIAAVARLRRADDRGDQQSRRSAHGDGCGVPRRADDDGHGDGGRRDGVARCARALPPRRAERARASRRPARRSTQGAAARGRPVRASRHAAPMSSPRSTEFSSRSTGTAARCGPASRPAASTAPGIPRVRPRRSTTRPTASSTAGVSRAGSGRAIAASSSRLPIAGSCRDRHRGHRGGARADRGPRQAHAGDCRSDSCKSPPPGDARVTLKLECLQVTGSFKARGAMNRLLGATRGERRQRHRHRLGRQPRACRGANGVRGERPRHHLRSLRRLAGKGRQDEGLGCQGRDRRRHVGRVQRRRTRLRGADRRRLFPSLRRSAGGRGAGDARPRNPRRPAGHRRDSRRDRRRRADLRPCDRHSRAAAFGQDHRRRADRLADAEGLHRRRAASSRWRRSPRGSPPCRAG